MKSDNNAKDQINLELAYLRHKVAHLETVNQELNRELFKYKEHLDDLVENRTEAINQANHTLQEEVSRRQCAEEKLAAERQRLYSVLDGLPAQVYLIAPDYSFRFSNRFFQERFGKPRSDACYTVFHGRKEPCENCSTFVGGGKIQEKNDEWAYPDGYTYQVYDYPFTDVDGTELLLSFGLDITEQKKAEIALRKSEANLRQITDNMLDMIWYTDVNNIIQYANPSHRTTLGYLPEDLVGKSIFHFIHPDDAHILLDSNQLNSPIGKIEYRLRHSDGHYLPVEIVSNLINTDREQISGAIFCIRDVTERKKIEAEMMRLDRLNFVGEMAASIGHEIRNPMTSIRGFLQLLRNQDEYAKDLVFFDLMIEELDRANDIISEYLGMAKDKRVDLQPKFLDVVVKSLLPMIQADANYKEMDVKLDLSKPPMPFIDEQEIRQMILNLSRNGLEAMSAGGTLTIGTRVDDKEIVLYIKDEGHGLDPDLLDKLGTPFITTKAQGTGLGLAVCYSIAARHKARIDFETGPEGTTFYVRFPQRIEQIVLF